MLAAIAYNSSGYSLLWFSSLTAHTDKFCQYQMAGDVWGENVKACFGKAGVLFYAKGLKKKKHRKG